VRGLIATVVVLLAIAFVPLSCRPTAISVGSKKFTESVVLGEMVTLLAEDAGTPASHYQQLGGTRYVFQALVNGDIDVYPEYTGTIAQEIVGPEASTSEAAMREALEAQGVRMSQPLGFNNAYVLGMRRARASELGIEKTSDLVRHPDLAFGFSNEFLDRQDGWPNLRRRYDLPQRNVTGLDHDLAYRQLELGQIDVIDAYATDAKIEAYDIKLLEDDLHFFPTYDAVLLYRADLEQRYPKALQSILRLQGAISVDQMRAANVRVDLGEMSERQVAAGFLERDLGVRVEYREPTTAERIWSRTLEQIELVRKSLIPAILIAVPLGVIAARFRRTGQGVLAVTGIIQTIPALALLVMLMTPVAWLGLASVGPGSATAVVALFLYSLLPIVRNTHAGLRGIAAEHREAAAALGLPPAFRLLRIELPLASRSIVAGIKTAAVMNVGFATLGALVGAGGYGQPILTGIRLNNTWLILEGAIPAAVMALVVQGGFDLSERTLVPKGLRIEENRS